MARVRRSIVGRSLLTQNSAILQRDIKLPDDTPEEEEVRVQKKYSNSSPEDLEEVLLDVEINL